MRAALAPYALKGQVQSNLTSFCWPRWLEQRFGQARLILTMSGALTIYPLVAIGYLVMSFASVHKVGGKQAVSALTSAFVCIAVVMSSIDTIIRGFFSFPAEDPIHTIRRIRMGDFCNLKTSCGSGAA